MSVERKIESLIEEASYRQYAMATQLQNLTPEERAALQSTLTQLKAAGKLGLKGAVGGAIGGLLVVL